MRIKGLNYYIYILFDVTMGLFDGAESCEMVVIYFLNKLSKILPIHQTSLDRDDGLIVIENANGRKIDVIRKKYIDVSKMKALK